MDIVLLFKNYLFSQKDQPTKITVKNYVSDVKKFITWYESTFNAAFTPLALSPEVIALFQSFLLSSTNGSLPAIRSTKRYISSLRKFSHFLELTGAIKANPFSTQQVVKTNDDPWQYKGFTNQLVHDKASSITIKNYLIDIKQFINWLERVTDAKKVEDDSRFLYIDNFAIEQYKYRLLKEDRFSPVSINRKLSSLRRYLRWLSDKSLLQMQPQIIDISHNDALVAEANTITNTSTNIEFTGADIPLTALKLLPAVSHTPEAKTLSRFAPIRLMQKTNSIITLAMDSLIVLPINASIEAIQYALWKRSGKKIFTPIKTMLGQSAETLTTVGTIAITEKTNSALMISKATNTFAKSLSYISHYIKPKSSSKPYTIRNISKAFYAPLKISLSELNWRQRLLHHLKYTRPAWYRTYHEYPIVHHIHFAILILATSVAGISTFYVANGGQQGNQAVLASVPNAPPRTIAFQGRLLDKTNSPIAAETNLRFAIYNSPSASDAAMLWQEVQEVNPNQDGYFNAVLGKKATLSQEVFTDNPNLYVGISVGGEKELQPRQQLPTVNYANNAQSLQGLKAITKTDKTANVLLALDSTGDLTIGGTASPKFQATGGQFTLSGQSLLLTTNPGSNGNIQISPDGSGIIDLQRPVQNTSNNNNGAGVPGAVAVDDLLAVAATSSTRSALTVRQNSTGDIISGYNEGTAKFRLQSTGDMMLSGNLAVNGNTITTSNTSFGIANTSVINLSIGNNASAVSLGGFSGITTINNDLTVRANTTLNGSATILGLVNASGGISIPTGKTLALADLPAGSIPFINNLNQLSHDTPNLNWSSSSKALNITGSLCIRSTVGTCAGSTAGTIYASNATVQAADLAENYVSKDPLEPGDIVIPEGMHNSLAVKKSSNAYQPQVIGIISTNPGFTLNSDAKPDTEHPYLYPLALQGRVPLKVSTINGAIKAGDSLTASSIPGVAMKATKPGQIIAKALEDYTNTDATYISRIMAFVNISYDSPQSYLTDSGNLSLAANLPQNQTSPTVTDATATMGEPLGNAVNFMMNLETGLVKIKEISTQTLTVTTDAVMVNGVQLNNYISQIVDKTITPYLSRDAFKNVQVRSFNTEATDLNLPIIAASTSADIKPDIQNSASPSAASDSIYNSIATTSGTPSPITKPTQTSLSVDTLPIPATTALYNSVIPMPASTPAQLGLDKLDVHDVSVSKSLSVLGRTTMTDVGITGTVNIGLMSINGLNDAQNGVGQNFASINTSVGPLKFQSDGYNGVDFLNGKITIDTSGNLKSLGNAYFAKDVTVKGTLAVNTIAPVPGSDLIVDLGKDNKQTELTVKNGSGNHVLSVNQNGDVNASGSGNFANITIIRGAQADTSVTQTLAAGSAGKGIIKAHQKERTIITPYVTKQSLVYVTATSDTQKMTPYVARQTVNDASTGTKGSFTIQIPSATDKDITFNWWIVN